MSNLLAARVIGALFLISTSSYMIGTELVYGIMALPDYLEQFSPNRDKLAIAALLEFVNSAALIGIAVVIYPIIRQYNERVAMGYVAFRVVEGVILIVGAVLTLSTVTVSEQLLEATAANAQASVEHFRLLGKTFLRERYYLFQMGMIALSICGFLLCLPLYKHKLVPRLLTALGLIGYPILLLKVTLDFFKIDIGGQLLYIPGGLFEFLVPLWLLFKGFNIPEQVIETTKK